MSLSPLSPFHLPLSSSVSGHSHSLKQAMETIRCKQMPRKGVIILSCILLFGLGLIGDNLCKSSSLLSSSYSSFHLPTAINGAINLGLPSASKPKAKSKIEHLVPPKYPNATFADLEARHLEWEEAPSAPVPRLDGAAIQIKNILYVFAGYGTIDYVHSHVDIYNFTDNKWSGRFEMPKEMANSHLGMATDGRYIYAVSGQYGPQCRGPTSRCFVLDTRTHKWHDFPSLPAPRYAPATQLWKGRLHVMGGSQENRHTPALDHWSLAVKDGKPLEKSWRTEIPIPRGGPHRASVVADDRLFVIGGQEGDFMAKPGSPIFKCSRRHEVVYGDVYMFEDGKKWKELPPMPKPDSHIEFAWIVVNDSIIIVGGTTEKHPVTKRMILVGEVFQFHINTLKWSVIGKLPFRIKTTLAAFWNGWLYFTSGQRDRGPDDPSPRKVIGSMWRTKLTLPTSP